jgi:hypothetical protein
MSINPSASARMMADAGSAIRLSSLIVGMTARNGVLHSRVLPLLQTRRRIVLERGLRFAKQGLRSTEIETGAQALA